MGLAMEESSSAMSLTALVDRCSHEIGNFRRGAEFDDQYCLELFRRAIMHQDQQAWEVLQEQFRKEVFGWMRRHPRREIACRFDSEENYVAHAFTRFWQATSRNQQIEFTSLASALHYLHASLNGAILDTVRAYSRSKETPLPDYEYFPNEPLVEDFKDKDSAELWEIIQGLLSNARERRLAYLLIHCGLKPREVVSHCSDEFEDVREIYRLRRNIFERLMRNRDHIRWQLSSSL